MLSGFPFQSGAAILSFLWNGTPWHCPVFLHVTARSCQQERGYTRERDRATLHAINQCTPMHLRVGVAGGGYARSVMSHCQWRRPPLALCFIGLSASSSEHMHMGAGTVALPYQLKGHPPHTVCHLEGLGERIWDSNKPLDKRRRGRPLLASP